MDYQRATTDVPCPLTGSREALVVADKDRHGAPLRTVISTESGLVFTDPRPDETAVRQFYREEYRLQYKRVHTPKRKHVLRAGRKARSLVAKIVPHLPAGGTLLDAGSGGGEFLHACRAAGYNARGVEPNAGYARYSIEEYGLDVFNGFYQDANLPREGFDCITMFHVLEHLPEPVAALRLLSDSLRVGGVLLVEVPGVDSTRTAPGQKWHVGHLYNFSDATLRAAGAAAGLQTLWSRPGNANLSTMFTKTESDPAPLPVDDILRGAFEHTLGVLSHHTTTRHYSKPLVPLGRALQKAARAVDEFRVVRRYRNRTASQLLDDVAARRVA